MIPFTTHFSSGRGNTVEKIQDLASEAEVLPGISIQEDTLNGDRVDEILEEYLEGFADSEDITLEYKLMN